MAAFAMQNIGPDRYYIRLNSGAAEQEHDHALLLETARQRTRSLTAVLYLAEPDGFELNALTARAGVVARVKNVGVTLTAATTGWIGSLDRSAQGRPAEDPNFEKFPEIFQYQLRRLAVVPLRGDGDFLALLTLGRQTEEIFDAQALSIAERAGRLLTAVLERDSLKRKLLERKLIERAKGMLQQRRRLSEEQAYLLLRNNSRRRRIPIADLAREIIDTAVRTSPVGTWQAPAARLTQSGGVS